MHSKDLWGVYIRQLLDVLVDIAEFLMLGRDGVSPTLKEGEVILMMELIDLLQCVFGCWLCL